VTATLALRHQALLDQLEAAGDETREHLVALADDFGGSEPARSTSRATRILLRRFAEQAAAGLEMCEHLSVTSAAPWWIPSDPTVLRCAGCAEDLFMSWPAVPGCDVCGAQSIDPLVELVATPSLLLMRDDAPAAVPSALLAAVVCRDGCPRVAR